MENTALQPLCTAIATAFFLYIILPLYATAIFLYTILPKTQLQSIEFAISLLEFHSRLFQ